MTAFTSLALQPDFIDNLSSLNYLSMTPIQEQSLPTILSGKDIIAQAKTGSGKTAAFGIGLLHNLDVANYQTQALILCPTRELADQVATELRHLARTMANTKILTLCGGKPIGPQLASLDHQPHIVVGTPGRILKHLEKSSLLTDHTNMLVLDEADRMLDMGFHDEIMRVISFVPEKRQTLLFSATYPRSIKNISQAIQNDPVNIQLESLHDATKIKQYFFEVQNNQRISALVTLLKHYKPGSCLIFCNTKQQCHDLSNEVKKQGFYALALHGDLEQKDRDQALVRFSNQSISILIATDVAARGLDIKDLHAVINYELSQDPEVHIHRIGRTGRADKEGLALSLFTPAEAGRVNAIESYQKKPAEIMSLDSIEANDDRIIKPKMTTLLIHCGRKNKIRAGDVLGALTATSEISGDQIGKIKIFDKITYVAVYRDISHQALAILLDGKIKGRNYRVKKL